MGRRCDQPGTSVATWADVGDLAASFGATYRTGLPSLYCGDAGAKSIPAAVAGILPGLGDSTEPERSDGPGDEPDSLEVAQVLSAGVDDYLNKQFSPVQLVARVKAALRLKDAQDRADLLNRHLLECNKQLEQSLTARDTDLVQVRSALVLGLADLVCYRDTETISHVMRLQGYCSCLATEAANFPNFAGQIDRNFIEMLEYCAPLHDIGKSALPDHILGKTGVLEGDERLMMQAHTTIGAETLERVAQRHGSAVAFLHMAIDIARHHHERYDGQGYPDRLAGSAIPLAARVVSIGDVYDALRSRRVYKPALPHAAAVQLMIEGSSGQFDPVLLQAFQRCAPQFERIFREMPG